MRGVSRYLRYTHLITILHKSFTFGNVKTSFTLLSLNHDFFTTDDVDSLLQLRVES